MPQLLWIARRTTQRIGWGGVAAAFILAAIGTLVLVVLLPAREHLRLAQREVVELRAQAGVASRVAKPAVFGTAAQFNEFYRAFPPRAAMPDLVEKLYVAAGDHHIGLERGEYRLIADKGDYLTRYELVLPVKGDYVSIRKFVVQALVDVPTLALDNITFNRQKTEEPSVDAELRFTLFLGRE
ncbi:MAG TPA: hypothetical protein VN089_20175 [Duganella sp.]|nr:hypothetical protein [Duganella sp.]